MKPVILTFVAHYLPGYKSGGPVRTIANMVEQLGDEFEFRVVTADRDSFETESYCNVLVNSWNAVGKAQVYYAAGGAMSFAAVFRLIQRTAHDVLYLNSFFGYDFTTKALLSRRLGVIPARPVVLAPRGEFSEGALGLKGSKKLAYIRIANFMGLYRNIIWQASSVYEREDIRRIMAATAKWVHTAPDLPERLSTIRESDASFVLEVNRPLRIVFLSRISPMKNLDYALKVLQYVSIPVEFNIYGLVSDSHYFERCTRLMLKLPELVTAKYHGVVEHGVVAQVLAGHDLFFLPTRGENYGHAILEALSAGVPALLSDKTPWQDFDKAGVGWVRSLKKMEAFKEVIEDFAIRDGVWRLAQRERARKYARKVTENVEMKEQNISLFRNALQKAN